MIHYHGTPITPRAQLLRMEGRHFCVPFSDGRDAETCLRIGQSVMFDNGAFSAWKRGWPFDLEGFIAWLQPMLAHPHWGVVPDVVDGTVEQQREMVAKWPYGKDLGAPVWHLGEPIDRLLELAGEWPKVCFGSSGQYASINTPQWGNRMDEAFNALSKRFVRLPWIHGLRMLGQAGKDWPLASADSTNIAQNHSRNTGCTECMAQRLDATQTPVSWAPREAQADIFT